MKDLREVLKSQIVKIICDFEGLKSCILEYEYGLLSQIFGEYFWGHAVGFFKKILETCWD